MRRPALPADNPTHNIVLSGKPLVLVLRSLGVVMHLPMPEPLAARWMCNYQYPFNRRVPILGSLLTRAYVNDLIDLCPIGIGFSLGPRSKFGCGNVGYQPVRTAPPDRSGLPRVPAMTLGDSGLSGYRQVRDEYRRTLTPVSTEGITN